MKKTAARSIYRFRLQSLYCWCYYYHYWCWWCSWWYCWLGEPRKSLLTWSGCTSYMPHHKIFATVLSCLFFLFWFSFIHPLHFPTFQDFCCSIAFSLIYIRHMLRTLRSFEDTRNIIKIFPHNISNVRIYTYFWYIYTMYIQKKTIIFCGNIRVNRNYTHTHTYTTTIHKVHHIIFTHTKKHKRMNAIQIHICARENIISLENNIIRVEMK